MDDLYERAGSKNVLHLHGELLKARSERNENLIYPSWKQDLYLEDKAQDGACLHPNIVWFGEEVPMMRQAAVQVEPREIFV